VLEAGDGPTGLRLAAERPGAIILDLLMPGMSGFEVLDRLKSDPATRDIPVIVHTGTTLTQEERERLSSAAEAVVLKSAISHEEAVRRVREALVGEEQANRIRR